MSLVITLRPTAKQLEDLPQFIYKTWNQIETKQFPLENTTINDGPILNGIKFEDTPINLQETKVAILKLLLPKQSSIDINNMINNQNFDSINDFDISKWHCGLDLFEDPNSFDNNLFVKLNDGGASAPGYAVASVNKMSFIPNNNNNKQWSNEFQFNNMKVFANQYESINSLVCIGDFKILYLTKGSPIRYFINNNNDNDPTNINPHDNVIQHENEIIVLLPNNSFTLFSYGFNLLEFVELMKINSNKNDSIDNFQINNNREFNELPQIPNNQDFILNNILDLPNDINNQNSLDTNKINDLTTTTNIDNQNQISFDNRNFSSPKFLLPNLTNYTTTINNSNNNILAPKPLTNSQNDIIPLREENSRINIQDATPKQFIDQLSTTTTTLNNNNTGTTTNNNNNFYFLNSTSTPCTPLNTILTPLTNINTNNSIITHGSNLNISITNSNLINNNSKKIYSPINLNLDNEPFVPKSNNPPSHNSTINLISTTNLLNNDSSNNNNNTSNNNPSSFLDSSIPSLTTINSPSINRSSINSNNLNISSTVDTNNNSNNYLDNISKSNNNNNIRSFNDSPKINNNIQTNPFNITTNSNQNDILNPTLPGYNNIPNSYSTYFSLNNNNTNNNNNNNNINNAITDSIISLRNRFSPSFNRKNSTSSFYNSSNNNNSLEQSQQISLDTNNLKKYTNANISSFEKDTLPMIAPNENSFGFPTSVQRNCDDFSNRKINFTATPSHLLKKTFRKNKFTVEKLSTFSQPHSPQKFKDKSFVCSNCEKGFSSTHHLTRHQRTVHMNVKPFNCPKCGKKFKRRDHVLQHLNKKIPCITP